MTNQIGSISQRNSAILAGFGWLITIAGLVLTFIGGTAPGLTVPGDAAATANKIVESGGLFRVGILGWLIVIIGDVVRA